VKRKRIDFSVFLAVLRLFISLNLVLEWTETLLAELYDPAHLLTASIIVIQPRIPTAEVKKFVLSRSKPLLIEADEDRKLVYEKIVVVVKNLDDLTMISIAEIQSLVLTALI
jgi:hypothetical protein